MDCSLLDVCSSFLPPPTPDYFEISNQASENNPLNIWKFPGCESVCLQEACVDVLKEETVPMPASGGLTYSQANQLQPNRVEVSEVSYKTKPEGGRAKLTPAQKQINRRQSDCKYRQKQKLMVKELKAENHRLTDEIRRLKAAMTWMHPNRQSHSQDLNKVEINISQSASQQHDNRSLSVQDHHGSNSGAADRLSSLEGNDLDLQNQKVPITAFATNRPIAQLFMQKIEADDESNVCFSDFTGLDGEYVNVGKYSFPLSLQPVVERIIAVYGDVSATTKMNLFIAEATYILFCASVKEMGDLQLEQVTEDRILKWRDAIKDALRINFKVDFAMEHLKKIARAYVSRIESQELESMGERISKLEADLNARREELAKRKEQCKKYMDAAKEFNGKSLSLHIADVC